MPELVLLPGMDGTGRLFDAFIAALDGRIPTRVIAYPRSGVTSYPELIAWVRERLPDSDFVLLGESFAGPVAVTLAAEHPERLTGLILCSTFVRNPRPLARHLSSLIGLMKATPAIARLASPALLGLRPETGVREQFVQAVGELTPETLQGRLRSVLTVDASERLAHVDVPVLCLRAARDVLVPNTAADWMQRMLPRVRTVDVDGPHGLLQASPGACARLVEAFLEALPAPP
jgi:pimeloyl-ACP methyl ester carboxylesterase